MADQDNLIVQIREKEEETAKMLEHAEKENNKKVAEANEKAEKLIAETEEKTKEMGKQRFAEAKEKGKEEYKSILMEVGSKRRDEIESGKGNLDKAKKHITDSFMDIFA